MNAKAMLMLHRVWGLHNLHTDRVSEARADSYRAHYQEVVASSLIDALRAEELAQILELIRKQDRGLLHLSELSKLVRLQRFSWLLDPNDKDTLLHVLHLTFRLWLFVTVDLDRQQDTLTQLVGKTFADALNVKDNDDMSRLSDDFSAKNLERRGGFVIHWTSELTDHLTCVDRKVIKVFRHGSALQGYLDRKDGLENFIYPDGLLSEIDSTFYLLFPYEGAKAAKHARRESKKRRVDLIEAGWADDAVGEFSRLQLSTYPRFRNRLAEIQRRYDAAKPVHPKQWWYDRRRRLEWAALMIAVFVFILTLITVVTSIMQVYAAFRTQD